MTKKTRECVLLVGLRADAVDYRKWPQLSREKLETAFVEVIGELDQAGYRGIWCLTDQGETAADQVQEALIREQPDIVMIGAGVRTDPDLLLLFETLINLVHRYAPIARIAFNQLPNDTLTAVKRWSEES